VRNQTNQSRRRSGPAGRRFSASTVTVPVLLLVAVVGWGGGYGAIILEGNFREVVPQRVYRSGQPTPGQLQEWIQRYQLKTVVNLRGATAPVAAEEGAVAAALGVDYVCIELGAYRLMTKGELTQVIQILENARQPLLIHCYHGVDRAGTVSALAEWLLGGRSYRHARWQAYVLPGPWKRKAGSGHISDTLTVYEDYCRTHHWDPDDPSRFKDWARNIYDPPLSKVGLLGLMSRPAVKTTVGASPRAASEPPPSE